MFSFRRLATTSTVATLLLVAIGGLVRATDSGLGCGDDWPDCNGKLIPVLDARPVIIEWTHRAVAMIVGFLVLALFLKAFRHFRDRPGLVRLSGAALALVIFQGLLGRVVVKGELEVLLVVGHLATAMVFLATLIGVVAASARAEGAVDGPTDPGVFRLAAWAAVAVFVLLVVGSYTSDFGYMPGWPLQQGRIVPNLDTENQAVHFLHRTLAGVVAVIVVWVAVQISRRTPAASLAGRLARVAAALFIAEIFIGALNVWTALNPIVVMFHLATGAGVWASLVAIAAVTSPAVEHLGATKGVPGSSTAALEPGR
jgi:heme A synthase